MSLAARVEAFTKCDAKTEKRQLDHQETLFLDLALAASQYYRTTIFVYITDQMQQRHDTY